MNMRFLTTMVACVLTALSVSAADPMLTDYSFTDCEGSLTPYPVDVTPVAHPDSLVPVFINHLGRHGARYPASAANCLKLRRALERADSAGSITALGRSLAALNNHVIALSSDRWGALDSVGMAEQRGIASRMFFNFTDVFSRGKDVRAISSYSPRSMMSMFSFVHQLDRLDNRLTFTTNTGRDNSALMRPFDIDKDYIEFRKENKYKEVYDDYFKKFCPVSAIERVLGKSYPYASEDERKDLAITEYYVVAGLSAMGLPSQMETYFSRAEANALWSCFNLRQYLQRTATTLSSVPADIASALVLDFVETADAYVNGENQTTCAVLRFGHAETVMPFVSLLKLPGCYYLTNYFDTVASHWKDFDVVPMASNVQMIIFKAKKSGRYYVRLDLNEKPVRLRQGDDSVYYLWGELRRYMMECVPL